MNSNEKSEISICLGKNEILLVILLVVTRFTLVIMFASSTCITIPFIKKNYNYKKYIYIKLLLVFEFVAVNREIHSFLSNLQKEISKY